MSDRCRICHQDFTDPSFGGPGICPACDCGIPPDVTRLQRTVAALTAENERLRENEHTLRMGWWLSHGCSGLYGDDGEMQCGQCMVDFKRDDPRDIETRIKNANMLKLSLKLSRAALPSTRETPPPDKTREIL